MMNAILSNEVIHKNKIRLAKPSRELIFKFGQGYLNISGSTMDFLMYLNPFVDLEGKIVIPLEQAKYDLHMQTGTFQRVIRESLYHKLINKKGNDYYSNFHIHTDGSDKQDYVRLLQAYTSPCVRSYSLRYKRLFYYFISVSRMGIWQRYHIENLYNNKVRKENVGVDYFDSFFEISNALLTLVRDGLIEIKLPDLTNNRSTFNTDKELVLNANTPELHKQFYSHFGLSIGQKKTRTSTNMSKRNVIQVRISGAVANDNLKLSASETEFILLAEANSIAWNEIKSESIDHLIGYKNDLFRLAGNTGLAIYRKSIQRYLKDHNHNVLYYDQLNKLANYFMDFYLLKEIQNILIGAAYHQKNMYGLLQSDTELIICHEYRINLSAIGGLLHFFNEHGSLNHKVLLDGSIFEKDIKYQQLVFNHEQWLDLKLTVEKEYSLRRNMLLQSDDVRRPFYYDQNEWRHFMIHCAKEGLFVKKEAFDNLIQELRTRNQLKVREIDRSIVKKVPFYNWLIERDRPIVEKVPFNNSLIERDRPIVKKVPFYNWLNERD